MSISTNRDSGIDKIKQHTDDLEDLADSELPCSNLAEAVLEVVNE